MNFKDSIKNLSGRIGSMKNNLKTEEATKNAFVLPFITALGYDVFNPLEVEPEMCCDFGIKKGEKVDYAILQDGQPTILIECKHWKQDLNQHANQLFRYFSVSKARFGILTNGIEYRFYTDLVEPNKMDEKPFLEINLLHIKDEQIEQLRMFQKSCFCTEQAIETANEIAHKCKLKELIASEFSHPSPDFVKFWGKQVYEKPFTAKVLEQFTQLVKKTIDDYVNERVAENLSVTEKENKTQEVPDNTLPNAVKETIPTIVTKELAPATVLKITFADGNTIQATKAIESLCQFIIKVGAERVHETGLCLYGEPLVSKVPHRNGRYKTLDNGWFVQSNTSTETKKKQIEQIAARLGLNLRVEIVSKPF